MDNLKKELELDVHRVPIDELCKKWNTNVNTGLTDAQVKETFGLLDYINIHVETEETGTDFWKEVKAVDESQVFNKIKRSASKLTRRPPAGRISKPQRQPSYGTRHKNNLRNKSEDKLRKLRR